MGTPSGLYYLFGLLMFTVAVYSVSLLVFSVTGRHHSGRDVDIADIFMGISMAGMFVTKWAFGSRAIWELIFATLMVWFIVRSIQSIRRSGLHKPHEAIHATMNFAMLLMYLYPMGASSGGSAMSMSMSAGAPKLDPGLGFVLAVTFFASAIFTLAAPVKGVSHHGAHALVYAMVGAVGTKEPEHAPASGTSTVETVLTTPWLEDLSHVVMAVAMGFMLILML